MRHIGNHDEMKTQKRPCYCGHNRAEHEIHPDTRCYKCDCVEFKHRRKIRCEGYTKFGSKWGMGGGEV